MFHYPSEGIFLQLKSVFVDSADPGVGMLSSFCSRSFCMFIIKEAKPNKQEKKQKTKKP